MTQLESKLGEVMGLAQAAQDSTSKVRKLVEDDEVAGTLERMQEEAAETERRCEALADDLDGKKTARHEKARETKSEAKQMVDTYLRDGADALDGLEFLLMAEAGELGHVEIVRELNRRKGDQRIAELADWALEVQQRHFEDTRRAALSEDRLAAERDRGGRLTDQPCGTVGFGGRDHGYRTRPVSEGITRGLCELALETRSPEQLASFYRTLFDWRELSRSDDRVWLACGERCRLGLWAPGPKEFGDRGGRQVHFALSVRPGQLERLIDRLEQRGIQHEGPVEHPGGDRSVYFEDPVGNVVEAWDFFERGEGAPKGVEALASSTSERSGNGMSNEGGA